MHNPAQPTESVIEIADTVDDKVQQAYAAIQKFAGSGKTLHLLAPGEMGEF